MERNAMLNVRVPEHLKAALLRAGDDDHGRSMSGMVVRALTEWLMERGYLPEQPKAVTTKRKGR